MQWCQRLEADYGIDPRVWQSLDGPSFRLSSKLCLGHMLHYVHSSLTYNSQKLERTQMPLNRGMHTENVVHLHNGVLLSY